MTFSWNDVVNLDTVWVLKTNSLQQSCTSEKNPKEKWHMEIYESLLLPCISTSFMSTSICLRSRITGSLFHTYCIWTMFCNKMANCSRFLCVWRIVCLSRPRCCAMFSSGDKQECVARARTSSDFTHFREVEMTTAFKGLHMVFFHP